MKQVLNVEVNNYKITITNDDLSEMMEEVNLLTSSQKRLFVVSKKVFKLYGKILNLKKDEVFIFPDGEKNKSIKNYIKILEFAAQKGLTRKDVLIAIGGGVVGDITGLAASTYMRGIDYIQIPTTLLSMVDSSVGGKTAINMKNAKNIIGTFYQPKEVFININFLNTINKRQFQSGVGEILKYAFIEESCNYREPIYFFEYLTLCCDKLYEHEPATLIRVIEQCLKLKVAVVEKDEKESDLRKILNLGHTLGHALEVNGRYKKYTHGESVIQGIFFVLDWAKKTELVTPSYYKHSMELLHKYGFKELRIKNFAKLAEIMKKDKKASTDKISFIIPCGKKQVKEIKFTPKEVLEMI